MSRAFALAFTVMTSPTLATAATATASPDAVFVTKAAHAGAQEVEVAKLGAAKAANADVRAFAKRLVQDHTTVNKELTSLAQAKDVKIPAAAQSAPADLAGLVGAEFDKAFISRMVKAHEAAIALFEGESRDGRDAEVKEWAARQLPTLRDHLATAKSLNT